MLHHYNVSMQQLSRKVKAGYGIGDLGGNLFFTMGGFYFLFYLTDVVGLAAGLAGTALMVGKIWDAVTDPVVGYLSDRTRSRLGRQVDRFESAAPHFRSAASSTCSRKRTR